MNKIKNPYIGLEEQWYNCFACVARIIRLD